MKPRVKGLQYYEVRLFKTPHLSDLNFLRTFFVPLFNAPLSVPLPFRQVWGVRYNDDGSHLLSVGADHNIMVYSVPKYPK